MKELSNKSQAFFFSNEEAQALRKFTLHRTANKLHTYSWTETWVLLCIPAGYISEDYHRHPLLLG